MHIYYIYIYIIYVCIYVHVFEFYIRRIHRWKQIHVCGIFSGISVYGNCLNIFDCNNILITKETNVHTSYKIYPTSVLYTYIILLAISLIKTFFNEGLLFHNIDLFIIYLTNSKSILLNNLYILHAEFIATLIISH